VLGGRLAFAGQSAGMLQESTMFINDYLAFAKLAPEVREAGTGGQEPGPFGPIGAADLAPVLYGAFGRPDLRAA
jgi:hypothetical protein